MTDKKEGVFEMPKTTLKKIPREAWIGAGLTAGLGGALSHAALHSNKDSRLSPKDKRRLSAQNILGLGLLGGTIGQTIHDTNSIRQKSLRDLDWRARVLMNRAKRFYKKAARLSPGARAALIGSGLGAASLGTIGYFSPAPLPGSKKTVPASELPPELRRFNAVSSAVAGATAGGGMGYASHLIRDLARKGGEYKKQIRKAVEDAYRSHEAPPRALGERLRRMTPEDREDIIQSMLKGRLTDYRKGPRGVWTKKASIRARASILEKLAASKEGKGWGEGESIQTKGIDRILRMTYDNERDGPRYTTRKNQYIKMIDRRSRG